MDNDATSEENEETSPQQALFGGNISGRRLLGVKVNPIYQESENQADAVLPIGEVQIEVYDSLPRPSPRAVRQQLSAPDLPSSRTDQLQASGTGQGHRKTLQASKSDTGEEALKEGRESGAVLQRAPGLSNIASVDYLPWTFLQGRSPAKRLPVWGAFSAIETPDGRHLAKGQEERLQSGSSHEPVTVVSSLSSDSRRDISPMDEIFITSEEDSEGDIHDLDSSETKESHEDHTISTVMDEKTGQWPLEPSKAGSLEYQTYFVTVDSGSPNLAQIIPPCSVPYGMRDSNQHKNGFSNCVHYKLCHAADKVVLHASDTNSFYIPGKKDSGIKYPNGYHGSSLHSQEDIRALCPCQCHRSKALTDVTYGYLVDNKDSEMVESICREQDKLKTILPKHVQCAVDQTESLPWDEQNTTSQGIRKAAKGLLLANTSSIIATRPEQHEHGEDCLLDLENNNNCLVLYSVGKCAWNTDCRSVSTESSDLIVNGQQLENPCRDLMEENSASEANDCRTSAKNGDLTDKGDLDPNVSSTDGTAGGKPDTPCEICGCCSESENNRKNFMVTPDVTSQYLHMPKDVSTLLSKDPIILRADTLNVQDYLQRYLLQAESDYLRQQNLQHAYDNVITSEVCSPTSMLEETPSTFPDSSVDVAPQTDELQNDVLNKECVSDVGDVDHNDMKKGGWRKAWRKSGSSLNNSKQSCRTASRQNSQHNRIAKPCSIEDVEMDQQDGVWAPEEMAAMSQWAGRSIARSGSLLTRCDSLKNSGLSIIHVSGTTSDPAFEMIVPCDEHFEEESNYSSRRRKRLAQWADQNAWEEEKKTPLRVRLIKAAIGALLICILIGIFVGVAIHFGTDNAAGGAAAEGRGIVPSGGAIAMK